MPPARLTRRLGATSASSCTPAGAAAAMPKLLRRRPSDMAGDRLLRRIGAAAKGASALAPSAGSWLLADWNSSLPAALAASCREGTAGAAAPALSCSRGGASPWARSGDSQGTGAGASAEAGMGEESKARHTWPLAKSSQQASWCMHAVRSPTTAAAPPPGAAAHASGSSAGSAACSAASPHSSCCGCGGGAAWESATSASS